jgi:hypothetical protein
VERGNEFLRTKEGRKMREGGGRGGEEVERKWKKGV